MTQFILAALLPGTAIALGEFIYRRFTIGAEVARKTIHLLSGVASISLVLIVSLPEIALLGLLFTLIMLAIKKYRLTTSLYQVKRQSYGELFFPLGVTAAALLSPTITIYILCVAIVACADTAASIVGERYGSYFFHILTARKSLEGSAAFFICSIFILYGLFPALSADKLLIVGVAATFTEAVSPIGLDNLSVPVIVAMVMRL